MIDNPTPSPQSSDEGKKMVTVYCMVTGCGPLTEHGGLLFGPPRREDSRSVKFHLCQKHFILACEAIAYLDAQQSQDASKEQEGSIPSHCLNNSVPMAVVGSIPTPAAQAEDEDVRAVREALNAFKGGVRAAQALYYLNRIEARLKAQNK